LLSQSSPFQSSTYSSFLPETVNATLRVPAEQLQQAQATSLQKSTWQDKGQAPCLTSQACKNPNWQRGVDIQPLNTVYSDTKGRGLETNQQVADLK